MHATLAKCFSAKAPEEQNPEVLGVETFGGWNSKFEFRFRPPET